MSTLELLGPPTEVNNGKSKQYSPCIPHQAITQVGGMLGGLTGAINLRGHRGLCGLFTFYFPTHSTGCDLNVQPRRPKNEGFMCIFV